MSRYIDADKILVKLNASYNSIAKQINKGTDAQRAAHFGVLENIMFVKSILDEEIPTADVAEVVRCKDCKYGEAHAEHCKCTIDDDREIYHPKNYFCAEGEKSLVSGGDADEQRKE